MIRFAAALAIVTMLTSGANAAARTVTLKVENMTCATCSYTVRESLKAVPGVIKVAVSFADKTATVTFDDARADVSKLTAATTKAGYPSSPRS